MLAAIFALLTQALPQAPLPLADFQQLCQDLHLQASTSLTTVEFSTGPDTFTSSGVVLDNLGHIIVPSRLPVITSSDAANYSITVVRADGIRFEAKVVAQSPSYRLSLLHAPELVGMGAKHLTQSRWIAPGALAFTYSNFLGAMPALNYSIVSSHCFQYQECLLQPINNRLANDDVAMVMNLDGELIGIVWPDAHALELQQNEMSFFVPIEVIYETFSELKAPWSKTRILGLVVSQELSDISPNESGESSWRLIIGSVRDGSAADVAGVMPKDQLISLGGKSLNSVLDLRRSLQSCPSKVELMVLRDGYPKLLSLVFE
jgi:S1-C subfamily serine protease